MEKQKCIVYIGDFDLRNENVQAHLVKNNAKILNRLGYIVAFVGVNRETPSEKIAVMPKIDSLGENNYYLELENTLSFRGLFKFKTVVSRILGFMDTISNSYKIDYVISYQSPTFAPVLSKVINWSRKKGAKYLVNCADITIFTSQPLFRRLVMTWNWNYLHRVNRQYSDGIIAVSRFIEDFYCREGVPSVIIPPLFDNYTDEHFNLAPVTTFVYAGMPFVLKKNVKTTGMKDRLDRIIDLCLQLSGEGIKYKLEVIGIDKELYTACIPRHKKNLEDNQDIVFRGRFSHQDTLDAIKNADFMINYRDVNIMNQAGLSTKLVESVSLGLPSL